MASMVGRMVVDAALTNQRGSGVNYGDVVYIDTAHDSSFTVGTTAGYTGMVGVCIELNGIAAGATGRIQIAGRCPQVNLNASGTRGHFIKTHTVAAQATDAGASRVTGAFGQLLASGSTPPVELFGFPDGSTGAAGSPGTPALTLGTTNTVGSNVTLVATDATIAAFDATAPVTQAFGDAAAVGTAGTAARRDHKHGMPAAPSTSISYSEALCTGDTTLTADTMTDAAGCSLSLAAGTWLLIGIGFFSCTSGTPYDLVSITDNSNAQQGSDGRGVQSVSGSSSAVALAIVTPGSTTTYKLRVQSGGGGTIKNLRYANGTENGTALRAIKLA